MHMRSSDKLKAEAGAANLLQACAGIEPGMKVLFVNEDGAGVDRELVSFLEGRARELGAQVSSIWPSRASSPDAIAPDVMDAIDAADCAIFNHQLGLAEPVTGTVEEGRITGFEGTPAASRQARDFLAGIGERFGKDPFRLNSWHAGVNPQTRVAFAAAQSLEQWMLLAHASPRILHFHAVGETMPGEISIAVLDPTVTIDGRVWWEAGQFRLLDDPEFQDIAGRWPGQAPFEPQQDIGV